MQQYKAKNATRAATEIILLRTNPKFRNKSFVIVEGKDDKTVFDNVVDHSFCEVRYAEGKSNVLSSIAVINQRNIKGVLAVVDADFSKINGSSNPSTNLFYTDTYDLESMLINSGALEKVLRQTFLRGYDISTIRRVAKLLRESSSAIGMVIGYLRWISLSRNLQLGFEKLSVVDFQQFIHTNPLNVDLAILISLAKSPNHICPLSDSDIEKEVQNLISSSIYDVSHVCHGKDLMIIICLILPEIFRRVKLGMVSTKLMSDMELNSQLRLAYELKHFYKTLLFTSLRNWEQLNPPFKVIEQI